MKNTDEILDALAGLVDLLAEAETIAAGSRATLPDDPALRTATLLSLATPAVIASHRSRAAKRATRATRATGAPSVDRAADAAREASEAHLAARTPAPVGEARTMARVR